MLTTLLLHKSGYGLKGIYSLEEYYARDLGSYYDALTVGTSHNYYMGRAEVDLTAWVEYFCSGMADAFATIRLKAIEAAKNSPVDQSTTLRKLDARQRKVMVLFEKEPYITTKQIADLLGIHRRTALNLCKQWVDDGFLTQLGTGNKNRRYELGSK